MLLQLVLECVSVAQLLRYTFLHMLEMVDDSMKQIIEEPLIIF